MTLVRWSPVLRRPARDLMSFENEVDRLFGSPSSRSDVAPLFTPAVDIEETPEAFVLRVDLPGMSHKDVKVSLTGDTLSIRGERKEESARKDGKAYHRTERIYGAFERTFTLSTPVRTDGVRAQYRDGVLEVHVPKAEEARAREIEVQVA